MNKIITIKNLKKSYGSIEAVKGISFYVEKGAFFSFLGENGAGKSTTIDILSTLLMPDSGEVEINGYRLGKENDGVRSSIGVVFQDNMLDDYLSVYENLMCRGSLYKLGASKLKKSISYVTEVIGLNDILDRKYGKLSGGQRRRSDIARALLTHPEILFLDEPTTGLDPKSREQVWQSIGNIRKSHNTTVFLTTHYLEEAKDSDYIAVIGKGKILDMGTPLQLRQKYARDMLSITANDIDYVKNYLDSTGVTYSEKNSNFTIELKSTLEALDIVIPIKSYLSNIEILNGSIDQAFININSELAESL